MSRIKMNYQKIYNNIINYRKHNKPFGYTEKHHIIPKCLGGLDTLENIIVLTAKEHFICHLLLTKIYSNNPKLLWAFNGMRRNPYKKRYINSKLYESYKGKYHHSNETKNKIKNYNIGKKLSDEHKKKISISRLNIPNLGDSYKGEKNGMFGKHLSNEAKEKISLSSKKYWNNLTNDQLDKIKKERSLRYSGEKNPRAKTYLISYENKNYIIKGGLKKFLKEHKLNYKTILSYQKNPNKIKAKKYEQLTITELK